MCQRHRWSLASRLAVLLVLIAVLPFLLLGWTVLRQVDTTLDRYAAEKLADRAHALQAAYSLSMVEIRLGMQQVATEPHVVEMLRARDLAGLRRLLAGWRTRLTAVDFWAFVDTGGQVIRRLDTDLMGDPLDPGGLVTRAFQQGDAVLANLVVPAAELSTYGTSLVNRAAADGIGLGLLQVAVIPVLDGHRPVGAVVAAVLLNQHPEMPGRLQPGGDTLAALYLGDHHLIGTQTATEATGRLPAPARTVLTDARPVQTVDQVNGREYRGRYEPVLDSAGRPVGVLWVGIPDQFSAGSGGLARTMLIAGACLLVLALGVGIWQGRRISRLVVIMTQAMQRASQGDLYAADLQLPTRDEIGAMAAAFNQMMRCLCDLATRDPLTALPNRRVLAENLARTISKAQRGRPGALLLLDLDDFKLVNDTLGHAAGDELLAILAVHLSRVLRSSDFIARLGGDEFAILLDDTALAEAQTLAERLRHEVNEIRFHYDGQTIAPSVSIGVAPIEGHLDPQATMALADAALYAGKELGRNRVTVYQSTDTRFSRLTEATGWATRLKDALREDRFVLHFQPIVGLDTGQAEYCEALVRLRGEKGQLTLPGAFIPAAERFGLMPALDRQVIEQVLQILPRNPSLRVFVNLSGTSLSNDSLLNFVADRLGSLALPAGQLNFEFAETAAVRDLAQTLRWLNRLRTFGCRFALDNFGLAFSSLATLRMLPVDIVKIDGSFIRNLDTDATSRSVVQAIHAVTRALGQETVATWVERESVAATLRELGIKYGQGHHWGLPGTDLAGRIAV